MKQRCSSTKMLFLLVALLLLVEPIASRSFQRASAVRAVMRQQRKHRAAAAASLRRSSSPSPSTNSHGHGQSHSHEQQQTALAIRGGGGGGKTTPKATAVAEAVAETMINVDDGSHSIGTPASLSKWNDKETLKKTALWISTASITTYILYTHRHALFDRQRLQDTTLKYLTAMNDNPRGLLYYMCGLAVWEALGLSTIPVETAAGMAFGLQRSIIASLTGKMSGAILAFLLGRHVLQSWVRMKLRENSHFQLIEASVNKAPTKTAVLLKYSCFPEFVKNYGTALLEPIPILTFIFATLIHGGPFTCLWSWLGHDATLRLVTPELPANRSLQLTVVIAMTVGIVASPIAMAWWIQSLRVEQQLLLKKQQSIDDRK